MSVNRKHVIWQSQNGTWSIGFWDFYNVNEDDEDWDYEWDVEYTDDFNWLSQGHATPDAASDAWNGSNPGGGEICEYSEESAAQCAIYDAKAAEFRAK